MVATKIAPSAIHRLRRSATRNVRLPELLPPEAACCFGFCCRALRGRTRAICQEACCGQLSLRLLMFLRMPLIGLNNLLHQRVANHVSLIEIYELYPGDSLQNLLHVNEPRHLPLRKIRLRHIAASLLPSNYTPAA